MNNEEIFSDQKKLSLLSRSKSYWLLLNLTQLSKINSNKQTLFCVQTKAIHIVFSKTIKSETKPSVKYSSDQVSKR